jgi:hypothetical protein
MVIDCHCHVGKGDGLTGPWNTAAPLGRYLHRGPWLVFNAWCSAPRSIRTIALPIAKCWHAVGKHAGCALQRNR